MKRFLFALTLLFSISAAGFGQSYFPGSWGNWENKTPQEAGFNPEKLQAAIEYAQSQESQSPRNLEENHYLGFGREPFGDGVGPFKTRGEQTGIIIKDGYIVAEWGEPFRVDMTFSVSKSFLSATVGLAYDRGLIRDVYDTVDEYMAPILVVEEVRGHRKAERLGEEKMMEPFKSEHNSSITWDHLLRQTSDWEGTLWGKPDWADRPSRNRSEWLNRPKNEPGTVWEYNDVRVNLLALAATNVIRTPLPAFLKANLMDKIGASPTWRWHGYENSWIVLDGRMVQVPSGGGHWGGGMFLSARDQARFGLLTLNRGMWNNEQILSEDWVTKSLTPTDVKTDYGFMNWFLNTDQKQLPSAPETAFLHVGAGTNMVYCDPEHNLVIVARWITNDAKDGIVKRVLEAME
ncbi:MAG: serine hydrolase [Bacteroidota bacterium]